MLINSIKKSELENLFKILINVKIIKYVRQWWKGKSIQPAVGSIDLWKKMLW